MSSTNNNDCPDLTPNTECNDSCCPDYEPQEDWCKAFNKRTLEQQRKAQQTAIDGMWHNLEDARNTIGQAEQYLAVIYELLLAVQDQIIKISSHAAATDGDIESANAKIKAFLGEVNQISLSANYNGRRLLEHGDNLTDTDDDGVYDSNDGEDAPAIVFRFMGCIGFCRTVDITANDFTYVPPQVSPYRLGIESLHQNGLGTVADVSANLSDLIDPAVKLVNCAIKDIGVALDKLRAYRYVLCLREKQIKICKNGQDICHEHKCKL